MNDTMLEGLDQEPWLEPFVEDVDEDLDPARTRWSRAVQEAKLELRRLGIEIFERATTADGYATTMLVLRTDRERKR